MTIDKRILKTKRLLRKTLISLLAVKPFEQITVTELCRASETSRITFYTHYNDKYALADDIFQEMMADTQADFLRLRDEETSPDDPFRGYCSLLDSIIRLYYRNLSFLGQATLNKNPYLYTSFGRHIMESVERYIDRESQTLRPKYTTKQVTSFLCYGIWGFITEGHAQGCTPEVIHRQTREIVRRMLEAELLTETIRA